MYCWTLMLRKWLAAPHSPRRIWTTLRLGLLLKRLRAHRPRPTVKLNLEILTERIVPSASSTVTLPTAPAALSAVADVRAQMTSTLDQWTHVVAIVQQDITNDWKMIAQEINQEVGQVEMRWDYLLGIISNAQNPSLNSVTPQPGNGMGRGNSSGAGSGGGATPTVSNVENQQSKISPQLASRSSGSGSGSVSSSSSGSGVAILISGLPIAATSRAPAA
jgi:hypothetical protein